MDLADLLGLTQTKIFWQAQKGLMTAIGGDHTVSVVFLTNLL